SKIWTAHSSSICLVPCTSGVNLEPHHSRIGVEQCYTVNACYKQTITTTARPLPQREWYLGYGWPDTVNASVTFALEGSKVHLYGDTGPTYGVYTIQVETPSNANNRRHSERGRDQVMRKSSDCPLLIVRDSLSTRVRQATRVC
ncbi:hypothetical protein FA13DRAFT_1729806, partial [Coprinellus micaceus]